MRPLTFIVPALFAFGVPAIAHATGGGEATSSGNLGVLIGVAIVALAYLLADSVKHAIERRFLVLTNLPYLLLGYLLSEGLMHIPNLPDWARVQVLGDMDMLLPLIALAAGWVGLLRGSEFDFDELRETRRTTWLIVVMHHLLPGLLVGGGAYYALSSGYLGDINPHVAGVSAAVLGCCAAADSAAAFDLIAARYVVRGTLSPLLRRAARFGDVFVIIAFSVVFAAFHGDASADISPSAWWLITLGLGCFMGFVFTRFLDGDESENGRFLALVGIITFASGAAYFLRLSPLAVNVVLGMWLVNSDAGRAIRKTLVSTEAPMDLVLVILAGALWTPSPLIPTLIGLAAFLLARLFGKWVGSWVAARGTELRRDLYRGLIDQGEVTVAMAVSFKLVYQRVFPEAEAINIAYSIILASVVINDIISPRILRGLLVDAGDLDRERTGDSDPPDERVAPVTPDVLPIGAAGALPPPPKLPSEAPQDA